MPHAKTVFKTIISEISHSPTVIFDLDSTLYDVSPRSQHILLNFSNEPEVQKLFPEEAQKLKNVKVRTGDWGIKEAFVRSQFQAPEDFFAKVKAYWNKHFFSSDWLHMDTPYKGAVEYVNALAERGVRILYLTGRDAQNMLPGTIKSLEQWGFPNQNLEEVLHMKPFKGSAEDEDFKALKILEIEKQASRVWFFENEPVIIHKVATTSPQVKIVWLDTTHSRKAADPTNVFTLRDYSLDKEDLDSGSL